MDRPLDPPRPVQVLTSTGEWADALLLGWDRDPQRGWMAVVVMRRYASEVRAARDGPAAHRPAGHPLHRRKGWTTG